MPVTTINIGTPDSKISKPPGQIVSVRTLLTPMAQEIVGEAYSVPVIIGVASRTTVWVEGTNVNQDRFRLEMCYHPVFNNNGELTVGSKWGQVGETISLSSFGRLVVSQSYVDLAYAIRAVRVSAAGAPTPGNFFFYVWNITG